MLTAAIAVYGGALLLHGARGTVHDCQITNTAVSARKVSGGVIAVGSAVGETTAFNSGDSPNPGGTREDCVGDDCPSAEMVPGNLQMIGCTIASVTAISRAASDRDALEGGVLMVRAAALALSACVVRDCYAEKTSGFGLAKGGALFIASGAVVLRNSTHFSNISLVGANSSGATLFKEGGSVIYLLPTPAGYWLPAAECLVYREPCSGSDVACQNDFELCSRTPGAEPGGHCTKATFSQPCDWSTYPEQIGEL